MTSPPSGCQRDFHPQAVEHARHTYYRLAKAAGLVDGLHEPDCAWSAHKTDIYQAIAQGCRDRYGKPLGLEAVRAGCLHDEM